VAQKLAKANAVDEIWLKGSRTESKYAFHMPKGWQKVGQHTRMTELDL